MQTPKSPSKTMATSQRGLDVWLQSTRDCLTLDEVVAQSGCSKRRIRQLIEHGLVDRALKMGSQARYGPKHVKQASAVSRLLDDGKYTLGELAWLLSPEADQYLMSVETLKHAEKLRSLRQQGLSYSIGRIAIIVPPEISPFERRALKAMFLAVKNVAGKERKLIEAARVALRSAAAN